MAQEEHDSERTNSGLPLAAVCLFAWALASTYTNHAPVIPVLMSQLGFTATEAGLLSLPFFLCLAGASLPAGLWSDRLGPKRVATFGLATVFAGNAGMGFADSVLAFMVLKALAGFGAGLAFVAGVRYVTVVFRARRVHVAQGLYGGSIQLGAGTSLYLMPVFYEYLGLSEAFLASSGLVAVALAFWVLAAPDQRVRLAPARWSLAFGSRTVWLLTLAHTGTFGLGMLVGTWITTFLYLDLGLSLSLAGGMGSAVLVAGIAARPAGGLTIDRGLVSSRTMIRVALLAGAIGLCLLALPGRPAWVAVIALVVVGIAFSISYAAVMDSAAVALPESPGASIGVVGGFSLILIAFGAPAMGALYSKSGSFPLAFGLLAAFSLLIFWATRQLPAENQSAV